MIEKLGVACRVHTHTHTQVLLAFVLIGMMFISCQHELNTSVQETDIANSTFLDIQTDDVFKGHIIYQEAIERFRQHLKIEEDILVWHIDCGNDINISDELFERIKLVHVRINESIYQGEIKAELKEGSIILVPQNILNTRFYNFDDPSKIKIDSSNRKQTFDQLFKIYEDYYDNIIEGDLRNYVLIDQIKWQKHTSYLRSIDGYNIFKDNEHYDYSFINQATTATPKEYF